MSARCPHPPVRRRSSSTVLARDVADSSATAGDGTTQSVSTSWRASCDLFPSFLLLPLQPSSCSHAIRTAVMDIPHIPHYKPIVTNCVPIICVRSFFADRLSRRGRVGGRRRRPSAES